MHDELPELTKLQFLIISLVGTKEIVGRELRQKLESEGKYKKSLPSFYQAMGRLEDLGFVVGRNEAKDVLGSTIVERYYKVTSKGLKARAQTYNFYVLFGQDSDRGLTDGATVN